MKKNTKRKGFTLVELLVVIAILAILATVSVVGYLSFTKKAQESKALQELKQASDIIYGEVLDGKGYKVTVGTDAAVIYTLQLTETGLSIKNDEAAVIDVDVLNSIFDAIDDLSSLEGTFTGTLSGEVWSKITYTITTGEDTVSATWDIVSNKVVAGSLQ